MATRQEILNKLIAAEKSFSGQQFVAPVINRHTVTVTRVAGVLCSMRTNVPRDFSGLGLFEALTVRTARFLGAASHRQAKFYLDQLPPVYVIAAFQEDGRWSVVSATRGQDLHFTGLVPLSLSDDRVRQFDTLVARFDGVNLWYQAVVPSMSLNAGFMRGHYDSEELPETIQCSGMSPRELAAYQVAREHKLEMLGDPEERRLKHALEGIGGRLVRYEAVDNVYRVTYEVDGHEDVTVVDQNSLIANFTTGICLSGRDSNFDLTTMVSVVRGYLARGPEYGGSF